MQALRAVADLADPALDGSHPDPAALAAELAAFAQGKDPRVLLEVVLAIGRLSW